MPQDMPPTGGYAQVQYKVSDAMQLQGPQWPRTSSTRAVKLTISLLSIAEHPCPRLQARLLYDWHALDHGLRFLQVLPRCP